ncbi:ABC transporter ATP-binding protein [Pseudoclavibacter sp. 13-3]|uniref:ABC transporter ATP-binding protein n=1 Tax=Pseudoclavibacter sp. 13-3 TaxID=2901228 RepID=UPI001E3297D2|nr:ABC transporter ATP-binding protein [Pseudoclavibacter sp. 13-3]MCD7101861.1 ABC transporter ATP-binding protein [Pseudoclavibacter sp. 13-3]
MTQTDDPTHPAHSVHAGGSAAAPTSTAAPAPIAVRSLSKSYHGRKVLDDITLDVRDGETLALLGPNGAGKTTLVETIIGFRRPDHGSVRLVGADPRHSTREMRNRVGVVLQETQESGVLTVREQLTHFAGMYDDPWSVDDLIASVGLTAAADRRVRALSGGQRRRLDVAQGVVGHPEVLFLDEPTTGFDPLARTAFWHLIDTIKAGGTTIVLTTHYLEEAAHLADRVAVIASGRLVALGSDLAQTPALADRPELHLPTVRWREDGRDRSEITATPGALIASITARLQGEPEHLEVCRPTLADAYLALIDDSTDERPAA